MPSSRDKTSLVVLGALVGVLGPIAWDWYTNRSAIELRHVGTTRLLAQTDRLDKVRVSYGDRVITALTQLDVVIANTGRVAIRAEDVVAPLTITVGPAGEILEARVEQRDPADLEASVAVNSKGRSVTVLFPLLNPDDAIRIALLVTETDPSLSVSARIAGIRRVALAEQSVSGQPAPNRITWTVYLVGAISTLLVIAVIAGFREFGQELNLRRLINAGALQFPSSGMRAQYEDFVRRVFLPVKTSDELKPLSAVLTSLPADRPASDDQVRALASAAITVANDLSAMKIGLSVISALAIFGLVYVVAKLI